jgi:hypothetical protein
VKSRPASRPVKTGNGFVSKIHSILGPALINRALVQLALTFVKEDFT